MDRLELNYEFLGSLIRYYRERRKIKRSDLLEVIKNETGRSYSLKTMQRVEKGGYSRRKYIYEDLGKNLNFNICEDNYEYHKLDKLINMTYDIINSGERITEYKRLLKYNETFYGEHSKDIYLSQLSRLNIAVFRYYLYGEFNDKGIINILKKCYPKLNKKAYYLACYLLAVTSINGKFDMAYSDNHEYGKEIADKRIYALEKIYYDSFSKTSYEIYNENIDKYSNLSEGDKLEKIKVLNNLVYGELNLKGYDDALRHLDEVLNMEDIEETISPYYLYTLYKRKGTVSFFKEDYQNCYENLYKVGNDFSHILGLNVTFLCVSAKKLGKEDTLLTMLRKHNSSSNEAEKLIKRFYLGLFKGNKKYSSLENLIVGSILPKVYKTRSAVYLRVFYEELEELVEKSGNTYKLLEYRNRIKDI